MDNEENEENSQREAIQSDGRSVKEWRIPSVHTADIQVAVLRHYEVGVCHIERHSVDGVEFFTV